MQRYTLTDTGRRALDNLFNHIARGNGIPSVSRDFAVEPTAEQRLISLQREEVSFLTQINDLPVPQLIGQVIGLNTEDFIGSRTSEENLPRKPSYVGGMSKREYRLEHTEFDTKLKWQLIDAWARFPNFPELYAKHVARSIGLSRISIGWHGLTAAPQSNKAQNPNGEDMNIGWLQKLRLERPSHVMGRALLNGTATGAAVPIHVHPDANYKNIDALAYDLIAGQPSWARNSTEHVVLVSQDLVDEKYFPMINRPLATAIDGGRSTSDETVGAIMMSSKQIGGRRAAIVPKFPEKTMAVTPLKNLSIYWQDGSRRRFIKDEPENMASLVDYNSSNEGYVIEDTDFMTMAENITFAAPDSPEEGG